MRTEPVAVAAAVRALMLAVAAFGFDLTGEQIAAVAIAVETVLALFVRSKVMPTDGLIWLDDEEEGDDEIVDAVSTYGFQPNEDTEV